MTWPPFNATCGADVLPVDARTCPALLVTVGIGDGTYTVTCHYHWLSQLFRCRFVVPS